MNNDILKLIIKQIRKYDLIKLFENEEPKQFERWISQLNNKQINNFLSLNIDINKIKFPVEILIDNDLLNCNDYSRRIDILINFKSCDDCYRPNFLKSKNFYKDIELLRNNSKARYGLWILSKKSFIKSPYHDEDLKLLIEAQSNNKDDTFNSKVSFFLAKVASDPDSIKSPYHKLDMKLIVKYICNGSQNVNIIKSLCNLAINKVSLSDKYHLENMHILATNPISNEFLYKIMTDYKIINGKNYRKEVEALVNSKSEYTSKALYYYIKNPGYQFGNSYYYDIENTSFIYNCNYIPGRSNKNYLKNLKIINQVKDEFVIYFTSILMNPDFINSRYKNFDLELLTSISSKTVFMDLYRLMFDDVFLNSIHHKEDAVIITKTNDERIRQLLLKKASNEFSISNINHRYDMDYISKLDIDNISDKIYNYIYYYIFDRKGIDDKEHIAILENLNKGILIDVDKDSCFLKYLNNLEEQLDENNDSSIEIIKSDLNNKILTFVKKIIHKE